MHSTDLELPNIAAMLVSENIGKVVAPISYVGAVPEDEKAYHMAYVDGEELARTNIERVWVDTTFRNVRDQHGPLSFTESGFAIHKLESSMTYNDFDNDRKIWDVYFKELEDCLQIFLGATQVQFFRYGIRKRHATFPVSTGEQYDFAQPTSIAHVDATLASTEEEMRKVFGNQAEHLMARRFQWVNVWKPLRGPVNDWPLCFCDASSVVAADIEVTDMVYPGHHTENQSLRYSKAQKWYYLSDHRPDEIIIFKQSDSDATAVGGVPHCSFANPAAGPKELPRESIEARALVIY